MELTIIDGTNASRKIISRPTIHKTKDLIEGFDTVPTNKKLTLFVFTYTQNGLKLLRIYTDMLLS